MLAQLGALSPTVVWEAHELSAWDTENPVLQTTVRSGVPVVAERVPLMPASLTAVQDFLQLVGPGDVAPQPQARPAAAVMPAPVAPAVAAPVRPAAVASAIPPSGVSRTDDAPPPRPTAPRPLHHEPRPDAAATMAR